MRLNGNHGKDHNDTVRLTAYITRAEKDGWQEMVALACAVDGIRNADSGTFIGRIIRSKLRLDLASLAKYVKTHTRGAPRAPARAKG